MKIKTRKVVQETKYWIDEITGEKHKYIEKYENGFVNEMEIDPKDVTMFSDNKSLRLIGIYKKGMFPMTLESWKETKKELSKMGILQKFNYSRAN